MNHTEFSKARKLSTPCAAWHVNYGGGCLNCGWELAERDGYPNPKRVTSSSPGHITGLMSEEEFYNKALGR
jgi:hypothetical protein